MTTEIQQTHAQEPKWFVQIVSDSGGEMFTPDSVEKFDDFESAKARYRQLRLEDYLSYDDERSEERMSEIRRGLDALGEDDYAEFTYENYDLDHPGTTYMRLTIKLLKTDRYTTETVYKL